MRRTTSLPAGRAAARGFGTGARGASGLERKRHVGDGGQSSGQGVHADRGRSRGGFARIDGSAGQYKVLFLQGGAPPNSRSFRESHPAGLGRRLHRHRHWSKKAIAEARRYCTVRVAPRRAMRCAVPAQSELNLTAGAAYAHYTPNERSAAWNSTTCRRLAGRLWSLTCPPTSCPVRST